MKEVYYYSQAKLRTQARLMLIKLKEELSHIWCVCTQKFSKKTLGGGESIGLTWQKSSN